jgi:hypothetical protein
MGSQGVTQLSRAFCSARDRNVPVLVRVGHPSAREPSRTSSPPDSGGDAPELVSCLDYGVRCTGWLCPLFPVPTVPPEELLEEAIQAERARRKRTIAEGRAILERAVKEGREWRGREARRKSSRRDRAAEGVPSDRPPTS